jgi:hypothetical protein
MATHAASQHDVLTDAGQLGPALDVVPAGLGGHPSANHSQSLAARLAAAALKASGDSVIQRIGTPLRELVARTRDDDEFFDRVLMVE